MSTPPYIAMPDGVAGIAPPGPPVPALLAEPASVRGQALLVPGITGSKEDFIAVLAPLAGHGWRVASMDLPGQCGSAALGGRGRHTAAALGRAVADMIDWLSPDQPVHLVGHSLGGLVTREVVLASPDRLASWTALCSGPAAIPERDHATLRRLQVALANAPMAHIWAEKEQLDRAAGWNPPTPEVGAFVRDRFLANDPSALADFAELLMTAPDRTDDVAAVRSRLGLSMAVITGAADDAWPVATQERMAARLDAPWHLMPGVGHSPAAEAPEATAALLDAVWRTGS